MNVEARKTLRASQRDKFVIVDLQVVVFFDVNDIPMDLQGCRLKDVQSRIDEAVGNYCIEELTSILD